MRWDVIRGVGGSIESVIGECVVDKRCGSFSSLSHSLSTRKIVNKELEFLMLDLIAKLTSDFFTL